MMVKEIKTMLKSILYLRRLRRRKLRMRRRQ